MNHRFIKDKLVPFCFTLSGGKILPESALPRLGVEVTPVAPQTTVRIPDKPDYNSASGALVEGKTVEFPATHVYRLNAQTHGDCLKKYGAVVLKGRRVVVSGVDENLARLAAVIPGFLQKKTREEEVVIAPWPHLWSTYGDFIFFTLPKLARLVAHLTPYEKERAVVLLPFSLGDWMHQYVELLGFPRERHVDIARERVGLSRSGILIAGDGPSHRQAIAHPDDLALARQLVLAGAGASPACGSRRIYVARKGRRKLENEAEVFEKLETLGFTFLADEPRTVREQIALFADAEAVVGTHGAGLCNAFWGRPDVAIVEAKTSAWHLRSFETWCAIRGARYGVLFDKRSGEEMRLDVAASLTDIKVDAERFLAAAQSVL